MKRNKKKIKKKMMKNIIKIFITKTQMIIKITQKIKIKKEDRC